MPDSNTYRKGAYSFALGDDLKSDLEDLRTVTGLNRTEIVRRALREYARQRIRTVTVPSDAAKRLMAKYGRRR